jgi:hypothetical protein
MNTDIRTQLVERERELREELRQCRAALAAIDALGGQPRRTRGSRARVARGTSPEMEARVADALAATYPRRWRVPELADHLGVSKWSVRRAAKQSSSIDVQYEVDDATNQRRVLLVHRPPHAVPERAMVQHSGPGQGE